jgi:hypothetical protein
MTDSATRTPDPASRPRGGNGQFVTNPDTVARDAEACRLRRDGHSLRNIADILGYASSGAVSDAIKRILDSVRAEPAADVRQMELDRLDELWQAAVTVLRKRHLAHSGGKLVEAVIDDVEVQLEDSKPVLDAIDRLLRIQARRAALLGLDAPTKAEVGGKVVLYSVEGVDMDKLT